MGSLRFVIAGMWVVLLLVPARGGEEDDPAFPPPLEFEPSEWLTNPPAPSVAVPDAVRGGELRLAWRNWVPTLRTEGPNSRLEALGDVHDLVYESLLSYDVSRGDYVPNLATHWWISEDKLTVRFRIDPEARWADGRPVTSDDVVATIEHLRNPDRKDPAVAAQWDAYIESARILDRLTVEVKAKEATWRPMLLLGFQDIYPARYIRMDGEAYLTGWNWKLPPGTGPYEIGPGGIVKPQSITLTRRDDWWRDDRPGGRGVYNFDEITWTVVRDPEVEYEMFLAGELDVYLVNRAERWVEELDDEEAIRQGWIQMRKIYEKVPDGFSGYCFNMRRPPFDDVRIRLSFAHLLHREKLFEEFFFQQYEYTDSYFPGQPWARPDARRVAYRPERARELLAEAGWTHRDSEGFLVNDEGERFPTLTLEFAPREWTRIHSVFKQDLWEEAGIELQLLLVDYPTLLEKVWEQEFRIAWWGWTASVFPNPEFGWHSKYADPPRTNNLGGFADPRADEILRAYRNEFDGRKRIELLQELDSILFAAHPYALGWYAPFFRILYQDRFGHPPEYADAYTRDLRNVITYWWLDRNRQKATEKNRSRGEPNHPDRPDHQVDEVLQDHWRDHEEPIDPEGR